MNKGLGTRFGMPLSNGDWRKMVKSLKEAREEFREYSGMMTPYERSIIERDIKDQAEKHFPVVSAGAIGTWKGAIRKYQEAGKAYDREVTREITRWDAGRLNNELQTVQTLVQLAIAGGGGSVLEGGSPGIAAQFEAIYAEAYQSGDIYKQRAAFEVVKAALPKVSGDDRFPVNRLAKLAEKDLSGLRVTEGMIQAKEAQGQAFNELLNVRAELIDVSQAIGEGDPTSPLASGAFAKALKMVQTDRETGEIKIYSEDKWDFIGGVFLPKETKTEG